ncbi:DNA polymerase III subunit beta [Patescibacteria group bacterium]
MKLSCTQENLKKAIFNIEKISNKQTSLPILKNIMLKAKDGKLFFYATNLEIGIISNVRAKVIKDGEFSIPARLLSDFVNNLPEKSSNIEISLEGGTFLSVNSGKHSAKIKGLTCEDFPIIPKPVGKYMFSVNNSTLREAISKVIGCVSNNDTRIEFTGVNVSLDGSDLYFAATDSFKLAESRIVLSDENVDIERIDELKSSPVIIPVNALFELNRVIGGESGDTEVLIENNQIFFNVSGEILIVSKLINGKYPNYKQIIPDNFKTELVINKDELLKSIRIASVFTNNNAKEVNLNIKALEEILVIEAKFQDFGENKTELKPIKVSGDDQDIILNPRYIIDGLNSISSSEVLILLNDNISPVAFRSIDDNKVNEEYIYIMMPIKKQ